MAKNAKLNHSDGNDNKIETKEKTKKNMDDHQGSKISLANSSDNSDEEKVTM